MMIAVRSLFRLLPFFCLLAATDVSAQYSTLHNRGVIPAPRIDNYYENPLPDQMPQLILALSSSGVFEREGSRFPALIFISAAIKHHPDKAIQWCKQLGDLSEQDKFDVGWAYHNAAIPGVEQCIQHDLGLNEQDQALVLQQMRYDPLQQSPASPGALDMLWATFFATGNPAAVDKIIDVVAWPMPEKGGERSFEILMMKEAAKWSLGSNVEQHRRVAEIVKVRQVAASGLLRTDLDEIMAKGGQQE